MSKSAMGLSSGDNHIDGRNYVRITSRESHNTMHYFPKQEMCHMSLGRAIPTCTHDPQQELLFYPMMPE